MASALVKPVTSLLACCVLWPLTVATGAPKFEDGPSGFGPQYVPETEQWQELTVQLPAWPREDRLIELQVNTAGAPFRVYVDPDSVTAGEDGVVRFTSVLVSSSGVWNVTYEGLHCGERSYRRFAYGVRERWHELPGSGWEKLTTSGAGRYRYVLYNDFMCDSLQAKTDTGLIVRKLRHPPRRIPD